MKNGAIYVKLEIITNEPRENANRDLFILKTNAKALVIRTITNVAVRHMYSYFEL